jgi:hypothetical protein
MNREEERRIIERGRKIMRDNGFGDVLTPLTVPREEGHTMIEYELELEDREERELRLEYEREYEQRAIRRRLWWYRHGAAIQETAWVVGALVMLAGAVYFVLSGYRGPLGY